MFNINLICLTCLSTNCVIVTRDDPAFYQDSIVVVCKTCDNTCDLLDCV